MKTTKRIFALLTAVILCLAPMALMVGASEHGVAPCAVHSATCGSCGSSNVSYTEYASPQLVVHETATPQYCYYYEYYTDRTVCNDCGVTHHNKIINRKWHPAFVLNEVNGRYECTDCNYFR